SARWELVLQQGVQPVQVPLREIEPRPARDIRQAQVLLVRKPVALAVEVRFLVGHPGDIFCWQVTCDERPARLTPLVVGRKTLQFCTAAPTLYGLHRSSHHVVLYWGSFAARQVQAQG